MSKVKFYLPLLVLGFIVSACGGGNGGGGNSSNIASTPERQPLNDAQQNLFEEIQTVITMKGAGNGGNEQSASPIVERNESESPIQFIRVTDDSPLEGKYYAIFSNDEYQMNGVNGEENPFANPTLVREPGNSELGKLGLSVGTDQGPIEIVMLFNSDGNAVIALSTFDDFVAGGTQFVGLPAGDYNYSGVNYFKIGDGQIQSDDFGLRVNFGDETGEFTSGLVGDITVTPENGRFTGGTVSMNVGNTSYSLNEVKGQFHGESDDSSVTGLYQGSADTNSEIKGAFIGTGTGN